MGKMRRMKNRDRPKNGKIMKSRLSYRRHRNTAPRRRIPAPGASMNYLHWSGQNFARVSFRGRKTKGGDE